MNVLNFLDVKLKKMDGSKTSIRDPIFILRLNFLKIGLKKIKFYFFVVKFKTSTTRRY